MDEQTGGHGMHECKMGRRRSAELKQGEGMQDEDK